TGDLQAVELGAVGRDDHLPDHRRGWRPEKVEPAALAVAVIARARGAADGARLPARGRRGVGLLEDRRSALIAVVGGPGPMTARAHDRHVAPGPTRTVIVERVSSDISS